MDDSQRAALYLRLRKAESASTVPGTLPVLFGDLLAAEVATVRLNPSDQEYLTKGGSMLSGLAQRFATIASVGASSRAELTDHQWWPMLRRIQSLAALDRHAVTEPTTRSGLIGEKSLVRRFCDQQYAGAAHLMLDVFEHFSPGWISPERASQLPRA